MLDCAGLSQRFEVGPLQVGCQLDDGLLATAFPATQQDIFGGKAVGEFDHLADDLFEMDVVKLGPVSFVLAEIVLLDPFVDGVEYSFDILHELQPFSGGGLVVQIAVAEQLGFVLVQVEASELFEDYRLLGFRRLMA